MIVKNTYPNELKPFEERLVDWSTKLGIKDVDVYIKKKMENKSSWKQNKYRRSFPREFC